MSLFDRPPTRYAIYYVPPPGPFARWGAEWLGWDAEAGCRLSHPLSTDALVAPARKYGFHATLKAPFRLVGPPEDLEAAVNDLAHRLSPVFPGALGLARLGTFLALVPQGDTRALNDLAGQVVAFLDPFRAPLTEAEIAHRKPERLTPKQRLLLDRWGYPKVMEEFRFHMTLTGPCDLAPEALAPHLEPVLPDPFTVDSLCLMGEGEDGMFRLIRRYPLSRSP
ncbi:DUF1045 domain-containing protein [Falsirhodobacter halotolerans]|uniref:DUF1045 domain-containing protein n=1 Tax=Falsirhodobacter halotolerans TaxID=1146892 RepID=UPI001FD3B73E|nr:DUF1045 domain-containing protein [Falsirhodobacter halotolerans]MCJ8140778.1 DUF1045 domain-containing protein [Falsirhodobacter halotolerans]